MMAKLRKKTFLIGLLLNIAVFFSFSQCSAENFLVKFEKEVGFSSYQQIMREKRVAHLSQTQTSKLNRMFKKLVQVSPRSHEINFSLTVVEDPEINAYALPGGYIFINTGLLNSVERDGELAGALAHEIAHVDCKHSINAIGRTIGFALALQMIANQSNNPDRAASVGGLAIGLTQKGYSREAEFQADRNGVKYMTAAGYSKNDFIYFFHKLAQKYGSGESFPLLQLISTHPPTAERIRRIEQMQ